MHLLSLGAAILDIPVINAIPVQAITGMEALVPWGYAYPVKLGMVYNVLIKDLAKDVYMRIIV